MIRSQITGSKSGPVIVQPPSLKPASTSISPIAPGGEGHIEMLAGVGGGQIFRICGYFVKPVVDCLLRHIPERRKLPADDLGDLALAVAVEPPRP